MHSAMRLLASTVLLVLVVAQGLNAEDAKPAATQPKKSNIIPSAGEVELTNGIGDVKPSGKCLPGSTCPGLHCPHAYSWWLCRSLSGRHQELLQRCKSWRWQDRHLLDQTDTPSQTREHRRWVAVDTSNTPANGLYSTDTVPTGRAVSDKCVEDVSQYKIDRSRHINRDIALGKYSSTKGCLDAAAASTAS